MDYIHYFEKQHTQSTIYAFLSIFQPSCNPFALSLTRLALLLVIHPYLKKFNWTLNLTIITIRTNIAPPSNDSETLCDLLGGKFDEAVDYKNDTDFIGHNKSKPSTPVGKDDSRHAVSMFIERDAADAITAACFPTEIVSTATITNSLDEQQQRTI